MNMKRMGFVQKHTCKFQNPPILAKVKDTYTLNQRKDNYLLKSQTGDQRSAWFLVSVIFVAKRGLKRGSSVKVIFEAEWILYALAKDEGRRKDEERMRWKIGGRKRDETEKRNEEKGGGGDRWWRGAGSNRTWKDTRSWYAVISTHYHAQCRQQGVTLHPLG